MPYGFAGGLAAGFGTGIDSGTQIAETQMKRQALLKEQINEKIKLAQGYVDAGLKNLNGIVSGAAQRDPKLEGVIQSYKGQLEDYANMVSSLGPEGQQAGQFMLQTINSYIPHLKTQSEANADKHLGEFHGAGMAADKASGAMPTPAAAPAAPAGAPAPAPSQGVPQMYGNPPDALDEMAAQFQQESAGAPAMAAPAGAPAAPQGAPAPTQMAQAPQGADPGKQSRDELFRFFLGQKGGEAGKITSGNEGRIAFMQTGLSELHQPSSGVGSPTRMQLLSKPSTWNKLQVFLPSGVAGPELASAQNSALKIARGGFYSLTGAAAPQQEADELFGLFLPKWYDHDDVAKAKVDGLMNFATRASEIMKTRSGDFISEEEAMGIMSQFLPASVKEAGGAGTQEAGAAGSTATAGPAEPPVGTVEDGYVYMGGGAGNPSNWRKK